MTLFSSLKNSTPWAMRRAFSVGLIVLATAGIAAPDGVSAQTAFEGGKKRLVVETIEERRSAGINKGKIVWQCGYVLPRKGKYKPRHVKIVKRDTKGGCYDYITKMLKKAGKKKAVVIRGFNASVSKAEIQKSIVESANR